MRLNTLAMMIAAALAGTSVNGLAADAARDRSGTFSVVDAPPPNYADSMARLKEATQRLREAIQHMAQQPAGDKRNTAIRQAHQALFDAQQAMVSLPPELYIDEGQKAQPNYSQAMEKLQQAADKLRQSVQAMAQQPAGQKRNEAAREAREAILETQQAMIALPPQIRAQAGGSGQSTGKQAGVSGAVAGGSQVGDGGEGTKATTGSSATGSVSRKTFSEVDRDNDGFISMTEAAADADAKQNFKSLDKNNDYKLSRSEWEAGQAPAAGGPTSDIEKRTR